jgi:hypothetical protein
MDHLMNISWLASAGAMGLASWISLSAYSAVAQPEMPPAANSPGVSPALSAAPPYHCAANRYVDGTNGSDANPGTQAQPWKTIQNADNWGGNVPKAGECVNVLPGTYRLTKSLILHSGGDSNSLTGYVVYRSTQPTGAHLVAAAELATGGNGDLITLWAPYIIVDGFDVDGNNAITPGHGIDGCASGGGPTNIAHHFVAINNVIHGMGGSGLNSCTADFITWRNNVVYGTSSTSRYQVSGINIWQPKALAPGSFTPTAWDNVPFGIQILYNVTHDNGEGPSIPPPHSDGNGIIIDRTFGGAKCPTCGTPYPGNILVVGNVSYNNGGSGVSVFLSKNVTVANNTVYNDYLDPANPATARGELSGGDSQNITFVNNIAIAVPGPGVRSNNKPIVIWPKSDGSRDGNTWTRNITWGAKVVAPDVSSDAIAGNMIGVDPKLTDLTKGDFVPLPGSPAIGAGQPRNYLLSSTPNIGAY